MNPNSSNPLGNNHGSTMVMALLALTALSLTVFMAADTALTNSKMMRSSRNYRDMLYNSESGISIAVESHRNTWLDANSDLFRPTSDFTDPADAEVSDTNVTIVNENGDDIKVAEYEVARIENNPQLGSISEEFHQLNHEAPPEIGSGYSGKNFEIRRYGIFSAGIKAQLQSQRVTVESGLWKVFNKS